MKKLTNPTESQIVVKILGDEYTLEANGSIEVSDDVANYWKNNLHSFLGISEVSTKTEEKSEEVKPKKESKK